MCLSFLVIEAEKLEVHGRSRLKLSGKQFTNMSDDTFTIYFNYNLLDCMDNAVYSSIDLSVKLETLNFEQRCQYKLKSVSHKEILRF